MKRMKSKLTALLSVACCGVACLGFVAVSQPKDENVVAKAATADELAAEFTNNGQFTVSPYSENMSISYQFDETLPSGSEGAVMRIKTVAGQAYVNVDFSNGQLKASDVASISVRAYSPDYTSADEFRFNNVSVEGNIGKYDMSTWCDIPVDISKIKTDENGYLTTVYFGLRDKGTISTYLYIDSITINEVVYTTYNLDGLTFRKWDANNNHIYLPLVGDWEKPNDAWTTDFLCKNGVGVTFGENKISTVRFPSEMFIELGAAPAEGDVLTIGGTFYNSGCAVEYVIPESKFVWNGTTWEAYEGTVTPDPTPDPEPEYSVTELGALTVHPHSAGTTTNAPKATQLYISSDVELPFTAWSDKFNLESGDGWKLNGNPITPAEFISADGHLFVNLANANVQVGDVLSVSGTFVHATEAAKYVIPESEFVWSGTVWEEYGGTVTPDPEPEPEPDPSPTEYTTYEMGKLSVRADVSKASMIYGKPENYALTKLPFNEWNHTFVLESGDGLRINGQPANMIEMQSPPDGVFFRFDAVTEVGTILSIGGTFTCDTKQAKYVIEESMFIWNGTKWENYVEYTTYNLDGLTFRMWDATNNHIYLLLVGDWERPNDAWTTDFLSKNGVGVMFGEKQISTVRFPGEMFIELGSAPAEGDVLTVGGTFYNTTCAVQYVVPESAFIYKNGVWNNELDIVKAETAVALDTYLATFVEGDYYEAEWIAIQAIVTDAKAAIDLAASKVDVEDLLNEAKAAMDEVATKTEMDANFPQWKENAKAELETYKDVTLYREAEQAIIAATVAQAKTDIDASTNWTEFNEAVVAAKAAIDALWTDAQWTAAEGVVAAAKDELASYKTESDYHAAEWATIQSIIAEANTELDAAIGNTTAIADIVTAAKAKLDAVKTGAQVEAEEMAVLTAKAELEGYKTQSEYNEAEWNEIESILAGAYARLEESIGDDEAIANIVAEAKAAMDKVLKAEEANAKAFAEAKANAEQEIQDYISGLNYDLYSDAAMEEINGYYTAAVDAIEAATDIDEFAPIVADMKAKIEGVAKLGSADTNPSDNDKKGCGSVVGAMPGLILLAGAGAATIALRKKKED